MTYAPNAARLHDPRPEYIRALLDDANLTQPEAAKRLGISERMLRYYLTDELSEQWRPAPYLVQYALEVLAQRIQPSTGGDLVDKPSEPNRYQR